MAKSAKKRRKAAVSGKKVGKTAAQQAKVAECVSCLLELHKLQGVLLAQLSREI
jgi:hypothetical protein